MLSYDKISREEYWANNTGCVFILSLIDIAKPLFPKATVSMLFLLLTLYWKAYLWINYLMETWKLNPEKESCHHKVSRKSWEEMCECSDPRPFVASKQLRRFGCRVPDWGWTKLDPQSNFNFNTSWFQINMIQNHVYRQEGSLPALPRSSWLWVMLRPVETHIIWLNELLLTEMHWWTL